MGNYAVEYYSIFKGYIMSRWCCLAITNTLEEAISVAESHIEQDHLSGNEYFVTYRIIDTHTKAIVWYDKWLTDSERTEDYADTQIFTSC